MFAGSGGPWGWKYFKSYAIIDWVVALSGRNIGREIKKVTPCRRYETPLCMSHR